MVFFIVTMVFLVGVDQLTKYIAVTSLEPIGSINVIPSVLNFTYVENYGAAFGILQNARWFFLVLALLGVGIIVWFLLKRPHNLLLRSSLSLIAAGALGNAIDRLFRGFVVDFIQLDFIDFPVFNIADICICVGAGLLILYVLLFDKKKEESHDNTIADGDGRN